MQMLTVQHLSGELSRKTDPHRGRQKTAEYVRDLAALVVKQAGADLSDNDREVFYRRPEQIKVNLQTTSKEGLPKNEYFCKNILPYLSDGFQSSTAGASLSRTGNHSLLRKAGYGIQKGKGHFCPGGDG